MRVNRIKSSTVATGLVRRKLAIWLACLSLLGANVVAAQKPPYYKRIKLVPDHKTIFTGMVYEGYGFNYEFDVKPGQTLTARLTGRGVTFSIQAYDMDPSRLSEEVTYWSGKLVRNSTGQYAIALSTERESARYRLEIELQ